MAWCHYRKCHQCFPSRLAMADGRTGWYLFNLQGQLQAGKSTSGVTGIRGLPLPFFRVQLAFSGSPYPAPARCPETLPTRYTQLSWASTRQLFLVNAQKRQLGFKELPGISMLPTLIRPLREPLLAQQASGRWRRVSPAAPCWPSTSSVQFSFGILYLSTLVSFAS